MEINFNFNVDEKDMSWSPQWSPVGEGGRKVPWAEVDRSAIIHDFFRAEINFSVGRVDFGPRGNSYPLVEYLLILEMACKELQVHRGSQVEASDMSFRMYFIRSEGGVMMSSDLTEEVPWIPMRKYHASVSRAIGKMSEEILLMHPGCRNNSFWDGLEKNRCGGGH